MDNCGAHHIAVFPWLAFGHMLPFLQLSKSLAKRGHRISFFSTHRNIQRLPKIPPHLAPLIDFVSLPLQKVESLPENAEATPDLPKDQVQYLKVAFYRLGGRLENFFEEASPKPDWIILDFACHWAPKLASKFGVPSALFSTFAAPFLLSSDPRNRSVAAVTICSKNLLRSGSTLILLVKTLNSL